MAVAEAAICMDEEGLEQLIGALSRLRGKRDHLHLTTPEWGSGELCAIKQGGDQYELLNHLRIVKL